MSQPIAETSDCDGNPLSADELIAKVAGEFFEQRAVGEKPYVEDFAKRYPEIADHIRRTFPALEFVGDSTHAGNLEMPVERPNERLGDFRISGELGRGGMGVVYEAEQLSIGRRVALKVLPFAALADHRAIARFRNEVRAAATLEHPNIVTVHSVGEERGIHYFAMQLIRGQSLAEVIHEIRKLREPAKATSGSDSGSVDSLARDTKPIAQASTSVPTASGNQFYRRVAELGAQVADALHFAHEQGIIHRDIKPGNLMLDDGGKIYVADFGLARIESDAGVTMTGDLIGTLRYMAPEQALAKRITVDHRADIYALGATLYEFATLQPVFDGTGREQLLRQVAFEQPKAPSKVARDIPRDLETIISKSLSKDPLDRYSTAEDVAVDLRRWLEDRPILGKRPSPLQVAQRIVRRNPTLSIGTLVGLLLLAGGLMLGITRANAAAEHQRRTGDAPAKNTAYNEYEEGRFEEVDRLLAATTPAAGQTDLRGFEWHLLDRMQKDIRIDDRLSFNERIRELRYSPGGRWLAVLTMAGQLSLIDLANDFRQTILKAESLQNSYFHVRMSSFFAFSPDDRYLYSAAHSKSGGDDSPLLRFDLTKNNSAPEEFSDGMIQPDCYAVAVGPDGRIATLGWSTEVETLENGTQYRKMTCAIRDRDTGEVISSNDTAGMTLAYSPRGTVAVAHSNLEDGVWEQYLTCFDDEQLRQVFQLKLDASARLVRFSRDGKLIAANADKGIRIWDVSGVEPRLLPQPLTASRWIWDVAFRDDGNYVATGGEDGKIEVWDTRTGNKIEQLSLLVPARAVSFSKNGSELTIGGTDELRFKPFREPTEWMEHVYMHVAAVHDGTAAMVTRKTHELVLWSPGEDKPESIASIWRDKEKPPGDGCDISFSGDGQFISVLRKAVGYRTTDDSPRDGIKPTVSIWRRNGQFVTEFEVSKTSVQQAKLTPDGNRLITVDRARHTLVMWDWRNGKRIATSAPFLGSASGMMVMRFSPSGIYLATGHGSPQQPGGVSVWKVEGDSIRLVNQFDSLDGIEDLAFTNDEQWIVGGDATGVELHNIETSAIRLLRTGSVRGVDVSPDGKTLVTAGGSIIRFWDCETGARMGHVDAGGFLTCVRFLDQHRLLYIVQGVGARILDATPNE